MSLHAQLSPDAVATLTRQQRQSTVTSIIISILSCLLIFLALLFWWLEPIQKTPVDIITYHGDKPKPIPPDKPSFERPIRHTPKAPTNNPTKNLVTPTQNKIALPVVDIETPQPSSDPGSGEELGNDWGTDIGTGTSSPGLPITITKRCSEQDRMNRLSNNGGNKQCEEAVISSLRWLKQTQNSDGSWTSDRKVSMTGFALLAFLGHCEHPESLEFGDAVTRAI